MNATSLRGTGPTPARLDGASERLGPGRRPAGDRPAEPEPDAGRDPAVPPSSPAAWALLALIRAYQRWISPALAPRCRFYPSCSAYAVTAIQRFGAVRGALLAAWRLLKCQPFHPGGIDHVPARPGRE